LICERDVFAVDYDASNAAAKGFFTVVLVQYIEVSHWASRPRSLRLSVSQLNIFRIQTALFDFC